MLARVLFYLYYLSLQKLNYLECGGVDLGGFKFQLRLYASFGEKTRVLCYLKLEISLRPKERIVKN